MKFQDCFSCLADNLKVSTTIPPKSDVFWTWGSSDEISSRSGMIKFWVAPCPICSWRHLLPFKLVFQVLVTNHVYRWSWAQASLSWDGQSYFTLKLYILGARFRSLRIRKGQFSNFVAPHWWLGYEVKIHRWLEPSSFSDLAMLLASSAEQVKRKELLFSWGADEDSPHP